MAPKHDDVREFLTRYPPAVQEVATAVRDVVRQALPDVRETLDTPARIVAYGFGPGYADSICTIIPSKTGVKLGIVRGADLPDPDGLLAGSGKRHRYVPLATRADVTGPALKRLLAVALAAWKQQAGKREPARKKDNAR
jgi:hypothetical protein